VIVRYTPGAAAVEEVFYSANVKTALKLAHVRGVALLAISEAGLDFGEYSPLEVKSSVVGYGRAEKSQVQLMVRSLLRLDSGTHTATNSKDACDALAVAICHATHASTRRRIARA
jgi:crossover junction endodeoxyribonuclease RuvC